MNFDLIQTYYMVSTEHELRLRHARRRAVTSGERSTTRRRRARPAGE